MASCSTIGINGLFLDHPRSGTGVYTREVLSRLLVAPETIQPSGGRALRYVVIGHPEHAAELASRARYLSLRAPLRAVSDNVEKVLWEQLSLPLAAARQRIDLLYAPYFSLPLWSGRRTMVTVHDVIPLLLPEYAPSAGLKAYFRLVSAAVRRADAVVTDSQHSAGDITRLLGVPPERIHVVYLGVDPRFSAPISADHISGLRARLDLPERFILYLGGHDPRKNLSVLLRALRLLRDRGRSTVPLVLSTPASGEFPHPREEAQRLGLGAEVIFLDGVSNEDQPALYAAALAFVFPSRYEGFGLPPLEAMAAGTPVLCATGSSLTEVTGDAAIGLDPDDVEDWAAALVRIALDERLRADLTARGREHVRQFTWERTVSELQAIFNRLLG